ncbi:MAG: glycosyl hydrolase family 28-related protein [Candidatus Latescibacteria bacterium]|nr:glycosyl hydrolase family 28-related protein [Candidatus Latescibacterota bacterium]
MSAQAFTTRSGRGTHPIPEGYGPRGPVGPSDEQLTVESPAAVVDAPGRHDAPYQAYPEDASGAFREAIGEAVGKGGGTVYVPPGTYRIDDTVSVPGNITIHGAGRSTLIYTAEQTTVFVTEGDNIRFTQFRLQGLTTVRMFQNRSKGISITNGCTGCRVDHLELFAFGHFAIGVTDNAEATVEYVYDHHNTQNGYGYGVMVGGGGHAVVTDSELEQNRHAIASNGAGTMYKCLHCYIHGDDETYRVGALDTHPGMSGEIEIAHNFVESQRTGLSLSDGSGRIHHNVFRNVRRFCNIHPGIHNGQYIEGSEVHDMVFEDNVLENVEIPFEIMAGRDITVDGEVLDLPPSRTHADVTVEEDSQKAIVDAIASVEASGGIVFIPSWTYELDAPIRVPTGVTLVGDEGSTRLVASGDRPALIVAGDNTRLCRLVLSRTETAEGPDAAGVIVESGADLRVDRCRISGHPRCGILFRGGSGTVEQNAFANCGDAAVISEGAEVTLQGNEVEEGEKELVEA